MSASRVTQEIGGNAGMEKGERGQRLEATKAVDSRQLHYSTATVQGNVKVRGVPGPVGVPRTAAARTHWWTCLAAGPVEATPKAANAARMRAHSSRCEGGPHTLLQLNARLASPAGCDVDTIQAAAPAELPMARLTACNRIPSRNSRAQCLIGRAAGKWGPMGVQDGPRCCQRYNVVCTSTIFDQLQVNISWHSEIHSVGQRQTRFMLLKMEGQSTEALPQSIGTVMPRGWSPALAAGAASRSFGTGGRVWKERRHRDARTGECGRDVSPMPHQLERSPAHVAGARRVPRGDGGGRARRRRWRRRSWRLGRHPIFSSPPPVPARRFQCCRVVHQWRNPVAAVDPLLDLIAPSA